MPNYEYMCRECGKLFEVQATFAEKSAGLQPECPDCHGMETHQVITTGLLVHASPGRSGGSCCGPDSGPSGCCG